MTFENKIYEFIYKMVLYINNIVETLKYYDRNITHLHLLLYLLLVFGLLLCLKDIRDTRRRKLREELSGEKIPDEVMDARYLEKAVKQDERMFKRLDYLKYIVYFVIFLLIVVVVFFNKSMYSNILEEVNKMLMKYIDSVFEIP